MDLSVGEVAKRCGVAVSTLHFYERKGLIVSHRNSGNQRRYQRHVLRRVAIIKAAQHVGLSLEDIAHALSILPLHQAPTKEQWETMANQWQEMLAAKIMHLQNLQRELGNCIGCGCLSLEQCQLRNPDDQQGKQGDGHNQL